MHIPNSKESTTKLLELINECNKVSEYEVYIQNSAVTLYTSNEQLEDKNFKKQPHLQ